MQHELDLLVEYQHRQAGAMSAVGKAYLGTILVATGQITQAELAGALRRQALSGRRLGEELVNAGEANAGQIEQGLVLQRKLVASALIAATMLAPLALTVSPAHAAQTASMQISVSVVANAQVRSEHQLAQLQVSGADVARGYVDAPLASRFSVLTNSRAGYRMQFYPLGELFDSVEIEGLANAVRLGADGGTIVQRGPIAASTPHALSYRFTLRPGTQPGKYLWPLVLSVRPL